MNDTLLFPQLTFPPPGNDTEFSLQPFKTDRIIKLDHSRQPFVAFSFFNPVIEKLQNGRTVTISIPEP